MDKIQQMAEELAAAFVKNYKCPLNEAIDFFHDKLTRNEAVSKIVTTAASEKQLAKNAAFKDLVKKSRKELYYKLRKYKNDDASKNELLQALQEGALKDELLAKLAQVHVSSGERFSQNEVFYNELAGIFSNASTIADIGCGVQPLFFPKHRFPNVLKYVAMDKDKESIDIMLRFKQVFDYDWLHPMVKNINEGLTEHFDVALILKMVPVVKRVDPMLLDELAKIPANKMVVSGVKESMVKKHDIEHKERRAINNFIKISGRTVEQEFEIDNEFFLILG